MIADETFNDFDTLACGQLVYINDIDPGPNFSPTITTTGLKRFDCLKKSAGKINTPVTVNGTCLGLSGIKEKQPCHVKNNVKILMKLDIIL